jgi:hypothetical protein
MYEYYRHVLDLRLLDLQRWWDKIALHIVSCRVNIYLDVACSAITGYALRQFTHIFQLIHWRMISRSKHVVVGVTI